jgi:poly-gamma-glutamate capsule biosynthesis protein CapA/YwtB (metallophosphatase superfamily)
LRSFALLVVVFGCGGGGGGRVASREVTKPAVAVEAPAEKPVEAPPPEATGARVLLAITGYSATRDDISMTQLARDYCSGTIAVVDAARAAADKKFDCKAPMTVALADFGKTAKTTIAVTDLDHVTNQFKALKVDGVSFFAQPHDYPLVMRSHGKSPDFAPHLTHFIMTGVTAITRATGAACEVHGIDWLTKNIRSEFDGADYVHVSNEVSIKPGCEYTTKTTYSFCTKERDFQALVDLHVNVVELTGNHNRDFGDEPFRKTFKWYADHQMKTFGAGLTPEGANEPILLDLADGKHLGIIGFNETCPLKECAKRPDEVGANAYDSAKAKADVAKLREMGADYVMVTVQFREWDNTEPTKSQAKIAHELVDFGADLVYGSQAHQLQLVEVYKGKMIFHGIGNLLFDQIHRQGVRQAFFLHHYFFQGKLVQSVPVFTYMSLDRQPTLATPAQAAEMKSIIFRDPLIYR